MGNAFTVIENRPGQVSGQLATQSGAYRQDLEEVAPFAPLRHNHKVECFTTGAKYFEDVYKAMLAAKKCIFIAGWQVNWDIELVDGHRLIDVLRDRVCSSDDFRVYVMPWMSPKVGVNTNDLDTMLAVFQLNAGRKSMQAFCCPSGGQSDYAGTEGAAYSHHQKLVVIDNEIAYVGGMDLAYGRRDDEHFSLDPAGRKFNERYNPGVPPSHTITPADGRCLSMMDLMSTVLTAGVWNAGGNTEPGALSRFLHSAMGKADRLAIEAVSLVNQGARKVVDTAVWLAKEEVAAAKSAGKAVVHGTEDTVIGASRAVSRQCAAVQIPDMYGAVISHKVGTEPTSSLPQTLRDAETGARKEWNEAVDNLASYLQPLQRLRVQPQAQSGIPDAIAGAERAGRRGMNVVIDGTAAVAGTIQEGATEVKAVCVEVAPAVERGVATINKAASQTAAAVSEQVNSFQRSIVAQINEVREAVNKGWLELVALKGQAWTAAKQAGIHGAQNAVSHLSQDKVQSIIDELKRLLKLLYVAQLALNWANAKAHPLLFQPGTKAAADAVLGPTQPREPWQDVHCRIEGAAVYDVAMNFVRRWDATNASYLSDQTLKDIGGSAGSSAGGVLGGRAGGVVGSELGSRLSASSSTLQGLRKLVQIGANVLPKEPAKAAGAAKPTGVSVRVLRSAPHKLRLQEAQARHEKLVGQEQHEIQTQMIKLISHATDFIYIENQFFQTEFGKPVVEAFSGRARVQQSAPISYLMSLPGNDLKARLSSAGEDTDSAEPNKARLPENKIGEALGDRIAQSIRAGHPFHVYLALPVHPEGALNDITVVGQIHWTMQSLVFADHSLVNRIRRAIKARELCKNPINDAEWRAALVKAEQKSAGGRPQYESVEPQQWGSYLTLLNLRNCEEVGGVVRTEQIYIHSKLLIVDDRHVLLGSANINDRSQSGHRDSEIAVMLLDTTEERVVLRDKEVKVNSLARNFRMNLWEKHFGLARNENKIVHAATEMKDLIKRPAALETIQTIQKLSRDNAQAYRKSFSHVPWSTRDSGASLWPVCPRGADIATAAKSAASMPFDKTFWEQGAQKPTPPEGVKGFFTALPVNWTIGEYNHPGEMSVMVLTDASGVIGPRTDAQAA